MQYTTVFDFILKIRNTLFSKIFSDEKVEYRDY